MRPVSRSPPSLMILHHARGDRGRRAGDAHAGAGVDDGDGVPGTNGGGLVDLHLAHITVGDVCVVGGRGQRDGRGDLLGGLDLVLEGRRVGRATGEGGTVGRRRVNGMQLFRLVLETRTKKRKRSYIIFGQQAGTEFQVIIEIKGATGLEAGPEGGDGGGLGEFAHALDTAELTLGVLRLGLGGSS